MNPGSDMIAARRPFLDLRGIEFRITRGQFALTAVVLTTTALTAAAVDHFYGEVAAALVFVLGITMAGALGGLAAALIAALGAFLIYNFYLTEPVLTFRLATGRDAAPLVIFNLCALVAGVMAGQLRDAAEAARRSNLQLNSLLELSQQLQSAVRSGDVVSIVTAAAHRISGLRVGVFRAVDGIVTSLGAEPRPDWLAFAEDVLADRNYAVRGGALLGRRIATDSVPPTAILVEARNARDIEHAFVDALSNLVLFALERAALLEEMTERRAVARAEELKSALLASVSHDFRTPLTAIAASASSLIAYSDKFDAQTSGRLLRGIVEECERLNRYTANLLEMSRLETAGEPVGLQVLGIGEMVAAAIQRARGRAAGRTITLVDDGGEALIVANPALFELVLVNLLDNAILYSDDESRVNVEIAADGGMCRIAVVDEGDGIPSDELTSVFDRFYRVKRSEAPKGSGLGLAIAKAFVEAHHGTIAASVPGMGDRGTRITVCLPLAVEGLMS